MRTIAAVVIVFFWIKVVFHFFVWQQSRTAWSILHDPVALSLVAGIVLGPFLIAIACQSAIVAILWSSVVIMGFLITGILILDEKFP